LGQNAKKDNDTIDDYCLHPVCDAQQKYRFLAILNRHRYPFGHDPSALTRHSRGDISFDDINAFSPVGHTPTKGYK
jgi:hypothetical protein